MDQQTIIARLREDRGSYPSIARATGVHYQTIIKISMGATKNPYGRTLKALGRYYERLDRLEADTQAVATAPVA